MCGRYTLATPSEALVETFQVPELSFTLEPRYNIAPGQLAPVVAADRRGRRMGLLRWGFLPKGVGARRPFVNARSETVASLPSFRAAFAARRCLVPADGFYEWRRSGDGASRSGHALPFWFRPIGHEVVSFAAIWERWTSSKGEERHGFAILTTRANAEVEAVHDRMPLVVGDDHRAHWLDRNTPRSDLLDLLRPTPDRTFEARRVSTRVNGTKEDDPSLIEAVDG